MHYLKKGNLLLSFKAQRSSLNGFEYILKKFYYMLKMRQRRFKDIVNFSRYLLGRGRVYFKKTVTRYSEVTKKQETRFNSLSYTLNNCCVTFAISVIRPFLKI